MKTAKNLRLFFDSANSILNGIKKCILLINVNLNLWLTLVKWPGYALATRFSVAGVVWWKSSKLFEKRLLVVLMSVKVQYQAKNLSQPCGSHAAVEKVTTASFSHRDPSSLSGCNTKKKLIVEMVWHSDWTWNPHPYLLQINKIIVFSQVANFFSLSFIFLGWMGKGCERPLNLSLI